MPATSLDFLMGREYPLRMAAQTQPESPMDRPSTDEGESGNSRSQHKLAHRGTDH